MSYNNLADVFGNFSKMCFDIYQLGPAKFLSASRLVCKAPLKLQLLTNIDILLMLEK